MPLISAISAVFIGDELSPNFVLESYKGKVLCWILFSGKDVIMIRLSASNVSKFLTRFLERGYTPCLLKFCLEQLLAYVVFNKKFSDT